MALRRSLDWLLPLAVAIALVAVQWVAFARQSSLSVLDIGDGIQLTPRLELLVRLDALWRAFLMSAATGVLIALPLAARPTRSRAVGVISALVLGVGLSYLALYVYPNSTRAVSAERNRLANMTRPAELGVFLDDFDSNPGAWRLHELVESQSTGKTPAGRDLSETQAASVRHLLRAAMLQSLFFATPFLACCAPKRFRWPWYATIPLAVCAKAGSVLLTPLAVDVDRLADRVWDWPLFWASTSPYLLLGLGGFLLAWRFGFRGLPSERDLGRRAGAGPGCAGRP